MAARMPCGSHKMIKWYEHWVITPFKMLKELIRSIDILFKIGNKRNIFVDITLKTIEGRCTLWWYKNMTIV